MCARGPKGVRGSVHMCIVPSKYLGEIIEFQGATQMKNLFCVIVLMLLFTTLAHGEIDPKLDVPIEERIYNPVITYVFLDNIRWKGKERWGLSTLTQDKKFCSIILIRSNPTRCLKHERRHCYQGNFHEGKISTEDC